MADSDAYPPPGSPPPEGPPPPGAPQQQSGQPTWFPPGYPQPGHPQPGYRPQGQPPPGYGYPPAPPPGYGYPPPPGYGYPPGGLAAPAHKPGAIPIRPLGLGDLYDGAFKIIRFSPGATVGSAVLVTAVAMAIPILVTGFLTTLFDLSLASFDSGESATEDIAANATRLGGSLLQAIGLIFVTGMIAHVVAAAAVGRRLSLGEAWAATSGKRGKLFGLTVLLGVGTFAYLAVAVLVVVIIALTLPQAAAITLGILGGLAAFAGLLFLWGRVYYLAVPPLMLEPIGALDALGRSWRLTSGQFWRTFGIGLLTIMITQIVGGILGFPFSIVGAVGTIAAGEGELSLMILVVSTALATVVSSAFVAPFTSAVTTLQYVDLRMRKEGYDVELLTRAGINPS